VSRIRTVVIAADAALGHELAEAVNRHPGLALAGACPIGPRGLLLTRRSGAEIALVAIGLRDRCDAVFIADLFDIGVEQVFVVSRAVDAELERTVTSAGARWLLRASVGPAAICESLVAAA